MNLYQWLLFLHVTGAFFLIGGVVTAGILHFNAIGKQRRPSEIATLYALVRYAVPLIYLGLLFTFAFGLWLVHEAQFGYGDGWVVTAIILWVIGSAIGSLGDKSQRETRLVAERLAAEGDAPSPDLRARVLSPLVLASTYASGLVALAVLGIMIWKPGA
jgi:uncharacterized membrane protein